MINQLTYQSSVMSAPFVMNLATKLENNALRNIMIGTRLYDVNKPHTLLIRNLKITSLASGTATKPTKKAVTKPKIPSTSTSAQKSDVKVTLPKEYSGIAKSLKVTKLSALPGIKELPVAMYKSFDISLGNNHKFAKPLTIEIKFNKTDLNPNIPVDKQLKLLYWDQNRRVFTKVPFTVDNAKSTIKFQTNHLSIYTLLMSATRVSGLALPLSAIVLEKDLMYGYWANGWDTMYPTDHFNLFFSQKSMANEFNASRPYKSYSNVHISGVPDYIIDTGAFLEQAYKSYESKGYNMKGVKYLYKFKLPVLVYPGFDDSNRSPLLGIMVLYSRWNSHDDIKAEAAHELFHAVQNGYYNSTEMWTSGGMVWYLEALAGYSSCKLPWDVKIDRQVDRKFFTSSIDTADGSHEYILARFFEYLKDNGIDSKDLFDSIYQSQNGIYAGFSNTLELMEKSIEAKGKTLLELYEGFYRDCLFNKRANSLNLSDFTSDYVTVAEGQNSIELNLNVNAKYGANSYAFKFNIGNNRKRSFKIMPNGFPEGTLVNGYILKGGNPSSFKMFGGISNQNHMMSVSNIENGDILVITAVNGSRTNAAFRLAFNESITDAQIIDDPTSGKPVIINFSTNIGDSSGDFEYTWYFGDNTSEVTSVPNVVHNYGFDASQSLSGGQNFTIRLLVKLKSTGEYVVDTTKVIVIGGMQWWLRWNKIN